MRCFFLLVFSFGVSSQDGPWRFRRLSVHPGNHSLRVDIDVQEAGADSDEQKNQLEPRARTQPLVEAPADGDTLTMCMPITPTDARL